MKQNKIFEKKEESIEKSNAQNSSNEDGSSKPDASAQEDWLFKELEIILEKIREKHGFDNKKIFSIIENEDESELKIPLSAFQNKNIGILETISKYLVEEKKLTYHEIAVLLKRDDRTIWASYHAANKKHPGKLIISNEATQSKIPVSIFTDRNLGPFEALVKYLKEELKMKNIEIAKALTRDPRTVWATYNSLKKKQNEAK